MAQGAPKTKSNPKPNSNSNALHHKTNAGVQKTKKGSRTIAPKKANLIKAQKMTKKLSAGLTAQTERMLGERAGHLEMLNGAKGRNKSNSNKVDGKIGAKKGGSGHKSATGGAAQGKR